MLPARQLRCICMSYMWHGYCACASSLQIPCCIFADTALQCPIVWVGRSHVQEGIWYLVIWSFSYGRPARNLWDSTCTGTTAYPYGGIRFFLTVLIQSALKTICLARLTRLCNKNNNQSMHCLCYSPKQCLCKIAEIFTMQRYYQSV